MDDLPWAAINTITIPARLIWLPFKNKIFVYNRKIYVPFVDD